MLNAYNNDIEYKNVWYHIQTEDNGIKIGSITTTVFYSGQILDSKTTSYLEEISGVSSEDDRNRIIKELMTKQYQIFCAKLMEGAYDAQVSNANQRISGAHPPIASHSAGTGSSSSSPSNVLPPSLHTANHSGQPEINGLSSLSKSGRPDILRASQQAPAAKSLSGLKPLSTLAQKAKLLQPISPIASGSPSFSSPASPSRTPSLRQPLPISNAVQRSLNSASHRAFLGVKWPSEDMSIDTLAAALLESAEI